MEGASPPSRVSRGMQVSCPPGVNLYRRSCLSEVKAVDVLRVGDNLLHADMGANPLTTLYSCALLMRR